MNTVINHWDYTGIRLRVPTRQLGGSQKHCVCLRFEDITAVTVKNAVICDVTHRASVTSYC
jgi:hypothetical protein